MRTINAHTVPLKVGVPACFIGEQRQLAEKCQRKSRKVSLSAIPETGFYQMGTTTRDKRRAAIASVRGCFLH